MAIVDKRKIIYRLRVPIAIVLAALAVYKSVGEELSHDFSDSLVLVLPVTLLINTDFYVGEILKMATNNIVLLIVGGLLGFGLRLCCEHFIKNDKSALIVRVIFALIVIILGDHVKCKDWVKKHDINVTAFIAATATAVLFTKQATNWLTDKSLAIAEVAGISLAAIVLSAFSPLNCAGAVIHDRTREHVNTLADVFKAFKGFLQEHTAEEDSQNIPWSKPLKEIKNSKEKDNSLIKFSGWELPWMHSQKQYEEIGDLICDCAYTVQSLSDCLISLQFTPELRENCCRICSELASALDQLSSSIKDKILPDASVDKCLTKASDLIEGMQCGDEITLRLYDSVKNIEVLAESIEELARLAPYKPEIVVRIKNLMSRFSAWLKKLRTKHSSFSDEPNISTQSEEVDMSDHVTIDMESLSDQSESNNMPNASTVQTSDSIK